MLRIEQALIKNLNRTERAIAHPESRRAMREELASCELLGETQDGKRTLLFDAFPGSIVMREIGRLREVTFRQVGEGTGKRSDIDHYDRCYRHIVLWDESNLEIVFKKQAVIMPDSILLGRMGKRLFFFMDFEHAKQ